MKDYILIVLLIFQSSGSYSQKESIAFTRLSAQNGLSNTWVRCVYQDDTGFMWFGTADGLNRYDGYDFKIFRPTDANHKSLGDIHINAILKKNDQELWICTDMGVYTFNFLTQESFYNLMLDKISVLCVHEDIDKRVWFGTSKGLFSYNPADSSMTSYLADVEESSGLSINYINTLFEDSESNLWIGTKNGLNLFDKKTGSVSAIQDVKVSKSLSGTDLMSICEDHNNRLWLGTMQDGLFVLMKDKTGKMLFKKVMEGNIVCLKVDYQNNLWIGSGSDKGLGKIELNDFLPEKEVLITQYQHDPADFASISDNSISCFYEDKLKDFWIGNADAGINFFSKREKKFNIVRENSLEKNTISNGLVNVFYEEDNYLWIGTEGGLDRLDKNNGNYTHYRHESNDPHSLGSNTIFAILKDSRGNLWVGTWSGGLNLFNYETETFKQFLAGKNAGTISSNNVISILEDSRGNLWIGTQGGGLNRYNYENNTFTRYIHDAHKPQSLYHASVNKILETSSGKLYISTYFSLDLYDYNNDYFTHYIYNKSNSSTGSKIISIYEDSRKNIWVPTNQGLELFNETNGVFEPYFSDSSLSNNVVQGLLEDAHGNLWTSTNNGIYKIIQGIQLPANPVFHNFSSIDGLSDDEFTKRATYRNKSGVMYFGSSKGFTYFHPDSISLNTVAPQIVLTEFLLLHSQPNDNNKYKSIPDNINVIDKLDLSYKNPDFIIRFASLNYLHTDKNRYQYKLEGYDKNWIDAGAERTATYTNIQPGKYTFIVKGTNNDGIWCESPKMLNIIIHPPWWGTILFKIILLVVALLLVLTFYLIRVSFLKRQNYFLEQKVIKRTNDISEMNMLLKEKQEEIITQNNELEKHRNHLEQLIEERTSELVKAKINAEESDRLKSSFLANISHEIRTPMNAIYGFSSLLNDVSLEADEKAQFLSIINTNCESLLGLIDDLLDISMIEANILRIKKGKLDVDIVLNELEEKFQHKNTKKIEIEFVNRAENFHLQIFNDEVRFVQIFTNLLNNAIKYTEIGQVKFGYEVYEDLVRFYVSDTGIGIDSSQIDRVFKQFYKIETDKQKQYRGTGIGLTISKKLVKLMGGEIWVESIVNQGSVFYFSLPYIKENDSMMKQELSENRKITWLNGITILIAEDDPTNFRLLNAMLKPSGGNIYWAQDGQEAVSFIKNKPVDEKCIVLMDIKMPVLNGYEATKQIKLIDEKIPVIAITAYAQLADKEKIMSSNFNGYIAKPFNLETLSSVLSKFASKNG
jgi:signal transduction histidine kinase/ligand-binding sensor domain-containing protein/ActR/RegA family two-component response regulator